MPKLQCSKSGLWYAVTTNHKKELEEKFEADGRDLETEYVSRDARRLMKEGKSEDEIRQMVADGELTSKTAAPKRASKPASSTPAPKSVPQPEDDEVTDDSVDPDIDGFMSGQAPEGEASNKAI